MDWLKLHNVFVVDPKFPAAAAAADCSVALAQATFLQALVYANQHEDRGSVAGIDLRVVAAALHEPVELIGRAWQALVEFGMIAGGRIAKWAKRQGEAAGYAVKAAVKERTPGAIRQSRYRRRKQEDARQTALDFGAEPDVEKGVTQGVTQASQGASPVTVSPAPPSRDSDRERPPYSPPTGGRAASGLRKAGRVIAAPPVQGEILLPMRGGRLTGRARQAADYRAYLADLVASRMAEGAGDAVAA